MLTLYLIDTHDNLMVAQLIK